MKIRISSNDNRKKFARNVPRLLSRKNVKVKKGCESYAAFYSLPFVAEKLRRNKGQPESWDVPATGGYFGGYDTGRAMALGWLKTQRAYPDHSGSSRLTGIIESLLIRFEQEGGVTALNGDTDGNDGMAALRGQYVGFFNTLGEWLTGAAYHHGDALDSITEGELLEAANDGIAFDHVAYMASLKNEDEDE